MYEKAINRFSEHLISHVPVKYSSDRFKCKSFFFFSENFVFLLYRVEDIHTKHYIEEE
jgi:hypothetical protein